jgi:hypothetical protein
MECVCCSIYLYWASEISMGISKKTQKILWARSGNRCAYCRCQLVLDGSSQDRETVIGDECHIIAEHENGPRGRSDKNSQDRDSYQNLILLCKSHHKMIDDQIETYTVQILTKLKADHEKWVKDTLEPNKRTNNTLQFIKLPLILDSKEIVQILTNASSHHIDYPTPENEYELNIIQEFIGEFEGLTLLSDEPAYIADAVYRIKGILGKLLPSGYYLYAKLSKGKLTLQDKQEMGWWHGLIVIKKFKIPEITIGYDPNLRF